MRDGRQGGGRTPAHLRCATGAASRCHLTAFSAAPPAAGNHAKHLSQEATYPAAYGATHPLVLTVGGSGLLGEWSPYASWDETAVHLSAPGTSILSTWPGGFVEWSSGG
jgi:hypothetical protein